MLHGCGYHIDIAGRRATLFIVGRVPVQAAPLIALCDRLPIAVDILCVNMDSVRHMSQTELAVVDALRNHWQRKRNGMFRVAFTLINRNRSHSYRVRLGAG